MRGGGGVNEKTDYLCKCKTIRYFLFKVSSVIIGSATGTSPWNAYFLQAVE